MKDYAFKMDFAEKIFATTLFVSDLEDSKEFYEKVFDKTPVFEDANSVVYKFGEILINLLKESEAPSLIEPAVVATKESGSRFQFTIQVSDVNSQADRLLSLGIALINGPTDRPWGVRTLLFADPDSHLWELAQE